MSDVKVGILYFIITITGILLTELGMKKLNQIYAFIGLFLTVCGLGTFIKTMIDVM